MRVLLILPVLRTGFSEVERLELKMRMLEGRTERGRHFPGQGSSRRSRLGESVRRCK